MFLCDIIYGKIAVGAGLVALLRKWLVLHRHQIDCNWVCTSKLVGQDVNTIIGDVIGWQNSKNIELSSSDDPIQVADWATAASQL